MFEIIKPGLILFAISLVASLSLGVVNEVTKAPIAALELQTEKDAQLELFPEATEFAELINFEKTNSVTKVVEALNGNELIGYILSAEPRGYGGPISMVVAISSDGSARGVKILDHSETPGLGANADSETFLGQYDGKGQGIAVTKQEPSGNEIQAITSATITSNAVTEGVNDCFEVVGIIK